MLRSLVHAAGLGDLWERAERGARLSRPALERILTSGHALAAAALADQSRRQRSGVVVTCPWTLRVRAPGVHFRSENETLVSHAVERLESVPATESQLVGELPEDMGLNQALEMVRSVKAARPDLPLRAFTSVQVDGIATREGLDLDVVFQEFAKAGLATLDWAPGDGLTHRAAELHREAHGAGLHTIAPLGYSKGGVDAGFLDRIDELRKVADDTDSFVSVAFLPDRAEGASPLQGTSGNEDTLACALARLGLGHCVPRVTVDAHILGHKLGAVLLHCGADDFVGAQAAEKWAAATNDGPRPLNPDRVRRYVIEARRSPELRDALFQSVEASHG